VDVRGGGRGVVEQWSPFQAVVGGRLPHHPFLPVHVQPGGGSAHAVPEVLCTALEQALGTPSAPF